MQAVELFSEGTLDGRKIKAHHASSQQRYAAWLHRRPSFLPVVAQVEMNHSRASVGLAEHAQKKVATPQDSRDAGEISALPWRALPKLSQRILGIHLYALWLTQHQVLHDAFEATLGPRCGKSCVDTSGYMHPGVQKFNNLAAT